jgi:tRNA wybutosine-synthesizing protein 1
MSESIVKSEMIPEWKRERMFKQQYRIVGHHSAVKMCYWCKKSFIKEGHCYKRDFYGIDTLNCLEMSPAITCNQRCRHCWRDTSVFSAGWVGPVDDPKDIIDGCLKGREVLINGFKGNDNVDPETFNRAQRPTHAAISLTGEPCMYPRLPELVEEFFKRGFRTVFLVTSGTVPEMLKEFFTHRAPTNIYLSMEATNETDYKTFCAPVLEDSWQKIQESLDILRQLKEKKRTRTVLRITCVKGFNMHDVKAFLPIIRKMQPDVIECKGYMYMGYSMLRLKRENMPLHEEVREFSQKLAELSGYRYENDVPKSTVCMLIDRHDEQTNGQRQDHQRHDNGGTAFQPRR